MKFNITKKLDTNQLEVSATFLMDSLNEAIIIESLSKAKDEIVKQVVEYWIEDNLQGLISQIDMKSLVNAVYLGIAREASKQINKGV